MTNVIERFRGDTAPDQFKLPNSIAGYTFRMTVSTVQDPVDGVGVLFTVVGLITSAPAGEFEFRPLLADVDQDVGTYYYDVEYTDAGGFIKTVDKGKYKFKQDISK